MDNIFKWANQVVQDSKDESVYINIKKQYAKKRQEQLKAQQRYAKTHKGKKMMKRVRNQSGKIVYVPVYVNSPSYPSYNNYNNRKFTERKIMCNDCGGTGRCKRCAGLGQVKDESYDNEGLNYMITCPLCNGTGTCRSCHGLGYIRY